MSLWKNVLLIAPSSDLANVAAEVRNVSDALRPFALLGDVTLQNVAEALSRQAWEIVWFAGHGGRESILLSGGDVLNTSTMIQLVKQAGARLVVLNTCESEQTGAWIHMQTGSAVICTIAEVGDASAYVTGTLLARNLAAGMDIEVAYNRSKPGDVGQANRYRLFDRTFSPTQGVTQLMEVLVLAQQPIMDALAGIVREMGEIRSDVGSLRGKVDTLSANAVTYTPLRRWMWALGAVMFAIPFAASSTWNLYAHGHDWIPYLVATVLWLTMSVGLLMYGLNFWRA